MKHFVMLLVIIAVTACGGGGGDQKQNLTNGGGDASNDRYAAYEYRLTSTGEYSGKGVRVGDKVYFKPMYLANSIYSVIAEATFENDGTVTFRLFDLQSKYHVKTIEADPTTGDAYDENGDWYNFELYGSNDHQGYNGQFQGVDEFANSVINPSLCYYDATATGERLQVELYNCPDVSLNGFYNGSVSYEGDKVVGVASNNYNAVVIEYDF